MTDHWTIPVNVDQMPAYARRRAGLKSTKEKLAELTERDPALYELTHGEPMPEQPEADHDG